MYRSRAAIERRCHFCKDGTETRQDAVQFGGDITKYLLYCVRAGRRESAF